MGRVDEARRRAADAAANAQPVADEPAASVPLSPIEDAETLSREPYPIEMAERRRVRPVPTPTPPAQAAPAPEPARTTVSEAPPATPLSTGRLFDRLNTTLAKKLVVDDTMMPASREQYRRLAATLHQQQAASGLKVIMISSAVGGEGKTLTASNLALTFSESYRRSVLLIDGDLRRPSLHNVFNIKDSVGLSEGLSALEEKPLTLHQITQRLTVLPAGRAISDPMAGLTSDRMRRLIEEAREAFDWVI